MKDKKPLDKYANDIKPWITAAECTYQGAMHLFNSGDPLLYISAGYLGHHALEMKLKAALIRLGYTVAPGKLEDRFAWGHELVSLAEAVASHFGNAFPIDEARSELPIFQAYFDEVRYPSELRELKDPEKKLDERKGQLLDKWMKELAPFARLERVKP